VVKYASSKWDSRDPYLPFFRSIPKGILNLRKDSMIALYLGLSAAMFSVFGSSRRVILENESKQDRAGNLWDKT
jgi:hypothetical protein